MPALLAKAQAVLNLALLSSPVTWIVAGVAVLIAAITVCCTKITGWGTLWKGVVGFMKNIFAAYVDTVRLEWTTLVNGIMLGLEKIKLGWYKFKEAAGMGDSGENRAAIAQINAEMEARKAAIGAGAAKVRKDLEAAKASLGGVELRWKGSGKATKAAGMGGTSGGLLPAVAGGWAAGGGLGGGLGTSARESVVGTSAGGNRSTNGLPLLQPRYIRHAFGLEGTER